MARTTEADVATAIQGVADYMDGDWLVTDLSDLSGRGEPAVLQVVSPDGRTFYLTVEEDRP